MSLRRRAVVVHRRTELDELLDRHATRGQVEFFLRTRGRTLDEVQARHDAVTAARATVAAAVPTDWALAEVERADLGRFLLAPEDVVVAVGQDGLVANVAAYVEAQLVIGVDPEPGRNAGVLVRHRPSAVAGLLRAVAGGPTGGADPRDAVGRAGAGDPTGGGDPRDAVGWVGRGEPRDAAVGRAVVGSPTGGGLRVTDLAMVRAVLDDGQELTALNEIFVGHPSHQSARYLLTVGPVDGAGTGIGGTADDGPHAGARAGVGERQSSSGVVVGTGTGATGWCASLAHDRGGRLLPGPTDPGLAWFVREAWPSPTTGADLTEGTLAPGEELRVRVESDALVVFGDGMETERLTATWGQEVRVALADRRLRLAA